MYIELHTSSAFSFLDGASLPATLIDRAAELGYPAVALLDRDGLYGAPQFYRAAKAAGIKAIVGAELTIRIRSRGLPEASRPARPRPLDACPCSCTSARRLPQSLPRHHAREAARAQGRVATDARGFRRPDHRAHRARRPAGAPGRAAWRRRARRSAHRRTFGRGRSGSSCSVTSAATSRRTCSRCSIWPRAFRVPVMASNGVRFATPEARPLYDVLTCMRHKTTLATAGRRLSVNAERYLKPPETMARLFADVPQALAGTEALAERLEFTLANLGYRFPEYPVPAGESQSSFLRRLAQVGARDRYRPYHDRARAQIARELDLIEKLDLAGYFLIVWDIVNFCRQQGILVQGRGSAANSAVCYALGHHRGRSGRHGAALRAVSLGGARRVAGHRSRSAERRSARARHSVRLRALRQARRGDDGQRHHVSRPSAAREVGKVLGFGEPRDRSPGADDEPVRVRGSRGDARRNTARGRPRSRRIRGRCSSCGSGARCRTCRAISASTRAAWSSARAGSTRSCRSRTRRCPAASSCSGTRTTARIWAS